MQYSSNKKTGVGRLFDWAFNHIPLKRIDWPVLVIVLIVSVIGFLMMFSAETAILDEGSIWGQLRFIVGGIALMMLITFVDIDVLNSHFGTLFFALAVLLNGLNAIRAVASNSISRGSNFQASEIMKLAVITFVAYMCCIFSSIITGKRKRAELKGESQWKIAKFLIDMVDSKKKVFWCTLLIIGISAGIVLLQSHLSGAIIVGVVGLLIAFAGGVDKKRLLIFSGIILAILLFVIIYPDILGDLIAFMQKHNLKGIQEYQYQRIWMWRYPNEEIPLKWEGVDRSQTTTSLMAIGSGGWFGRGYGNSIQKFSYLSESDTDFIFAMTVEELGYLRTLGILLLYAIMLWRCFKIATSVQSRFKSLVVMGISAQIAIELLLNIAVVTNSIPNTGITFPFFSYGGTAIIMLFAEMGVVLSVSKESFYTRKTLTKLFPVPLKFEAEITK